MGSLKFLLAIVLALGAAPSVVAAGDCFSGSVYAGDCGVTGEVGDDSVDLVGNENSPGGGSGGPGGGGSGGGAPGHGPGVTAPGISCPPGFVPVLVRGNPECVTEADRAGYDVTDPITLSDIASFRPTPALHRMQPDGWTIAGLHTNFYAVTGPHVVSGRLLGRAADVRFTPVAYHWDYGDGHSATKSTRGGTWSALGLDEFDRTPTSHVYDAQGDYVIRLSVDYTAEYRYADSGWVPIAGRLTLPSNELRITVGGAKTVLVDDDCRANPRGPGC